MSLSIGFILLTHRNPEQIYRLIAHLNRMFNYPTIVCHHDFSKCDLSVDTLPKNISFVRPHIETAWGEFSALTYLKSHPEIDLIQGGFFSDEDIIVADYYKPGKTINLKECVLGPTFFGKRKVFFELKGFDNIAYGEDTDFWQRAEKIFKTENITKPETYIYTRAETSITKSVLENISLHEN